MELKLVSFKLAKELKKIGFDIPTNHYYILEQPKITFSARDDGDIDYNWNDRKGNSAPPLELARMWFREKHNLEIDPYFCYTNRWQYEIIYINFSYHKDHVKVIISKDWSYIYLKTYEKALEFGLQGACKLIKK